LLGGVSTAASCAARVASLGATEVVVKDGARGAWVWCGDGVRRVPARPTTAVDTTAAGDSFNGAYLAARLVGWEVDAATAAGNAVAGVVIEVPGAIIDVRRMPGWPHPA
jgi:2-dehydro-3-deoxygluconokinase